MDRFSQFFKKVSSFFNKKETKSELTWKPAEATISTPKFTKEERKFRRTGSKLRGTVYHFRYFGNFSPVKYPNGVIK